MLIGGVSHSKKFCITQEKSIYLSNSPVSDDKRKEEEFMGEEKISITSHLRKKQVVQTHWSVWRLNFSFLRKIFLLKWFGDNHIHEFSANTLLILSIIFFCCFCVLMASLWSCTLKGTFTAFLRFLSVGHHWLICWKFYTSNVILSLISLYAEQLQAKALWNSWA